ncbi:hypothetical protein [Frankia sp. QA3]|uniref:hypothetical protein n=1 Tax=Frankia sp. QA3 TaxID=710111 RepID=UPI000269C49B|nr:hypothetical protein [Frankia sp. QA3]EIV94348.1 hypothetical protein FraQA3DRAFT_4097 [Frankia sp. QA3]
MPWRPRLESPEPHPRLGRYSHRVAWIFDGPNPIGYLLVVPDVYSIQTGGALWWRRWSEGRHGATLYLALPGTRFPFTDTIVWPDDLSEELDDWDLGRFQLVDETYDLRWLDEDESRSLIRS